MDTRTNDMSVRSLTRIRMWYGFLLVVFGIFVVRLFYLQIIQHQTYVKKAASDQMREYEVDADRGSIYAQLGDKTVPLVVNQKLYTVYADPTLIKQPTESASKLAPVLNVSTDSLQTLFAQKKLRYVILKKKVTADTSKQVLALKIPGVGTQERNYRTYPQGTLAAQLLGFVNDDGKGEYGLEQAMNKELAGTNGTLKAVTDVNGIPLAANNDNLLVQPVAGEDLTLTIDLGIQTQLEQIMKTAQESYKAKTVGAIVMESNTGAVKAMANYPTFDPANYQSVQDGSIFQNSVVTQPIEPGSITKVLTAAAALDSGAITPTSSYSDPGSWLIDGYRVTNIAEDGGPGTHDVADVLNMSLNTGATWMLMRMGGGGGQKITDQGRQTLYDYFSNHFRIGKETGVEQGYEGSGYLTGPENKDNGIGITYANMAFGQGYSASALQMVSALSAIINGGTYYQPHLVASRLVAGATKTEAPKVLVPNAVSVKTSEEMRSLMAYVVAGHSSYADMKFPANYQVGGKTGTAEIAKQGGGYRDDLFSGTYMGFVGGDKPQYTIIVYVVEPHSYKGYAGVGTGQPVFAQIAHMLIDKYGVAPKSK